MQTPMMLAVLALLLAILGILLDIAIHLRRLLVAAERLLAKLLSQKPRIDHFHQGAMKYSGAFSIWCFEGGSWVLLSHCGRPGCQCGTPPSAPGTYEGEVIRKECGGP